MGIRRLKSFLAAVFKENADQNPDLKTSGIHHFPSVSSFLQNERVRMYKQEVKCNNINNPFKQLRIKENIAIKPYFVGIDANLYASRYKRVFKKIEYGFLRQIILTLSSKMIPIYVFDGNAPYQKQKTILTRQNKKKNSRKKLENILFSRGVSREKLAELSPEEMVEHINYVYDDLDQYRRCDVNNVSSYLLYDTKNITDEYKEIIKLSKKSTNIEHKDIQNLKKFLDLIKIPYITAKNEADDLMGFLYENKIIQVCLSDDTDMLPKGCDNLIQITNQGVDQYFLPEVLEELKLSRIQFIDLCVLLGSDYYNTYLPKIAPLKLYHIFKSLKDPSLESFVEYYTTIDQNITSHLNSYIVARNSFLLVSESNAQMPKIQLCPLNTDIIVGYLEKMGIILNDSHNQQMRSSLKNANEFIISMD